MVYLYSSTYRCWRAALCHCRRPAKYACSCIYTWRVYVVCKVCTSYIFCCPQRQESRKNIYAGTTIDTDLWRPVFCLDSPLCFPYYRLSSAILLLCTPQHPVSIVTFHASVFTDNCENNFFVVFFDPINIFSDNENN